MRIPPIFSCLAALVLSGSFFPAHAAGSRPPNIVFIFSDDHAFQAISAYGEARRLLETPNIDRLAKEGMRFERCLVPDSICGPSRASVLTGNTPTSTGSTTTATAGSTRPSPPCRSCWPAISPRSSANGIWSAPPSDLLPLPGIMRVESVTTEGSDGLGAPQKSGERAPRRAPFLNSTERSA